ncbi:MAG: hypothetical protein P0Y50_11305 [Candidatus Brevundimonas colombiensis]|uniref:Uncharacterized protein n=1 Tax=Candidatus Brevundimonas colombiensis TaxID=3121376 RepID=A0AAJ5X407_9CAUL|nr:hypothetical protein [Brevundimonas sp.]WEK41594.1 MAG: hypothetical protein P0Y50_11305 [Brevundimonas sp.]
MEDADVLQGVGDADDEIVGLYDGHGVILRLSRRVEIFVAAGGLDDRRLVDPLSRLIQRRRDGSIASSHAAGADRLQDQGVVCTRRSLVQQSPRPVRRSGGF